MPRLRYGNLKTDNRYTLKVLAIIIVGSVLAFFLYYAFLYRSSIRLCNEGHQGSLDTLLAQAQTVLADPRSACVTSYELITDWGMCIGSAQSVVPPKLTAYIYPITTNIMMFFREQKKDIEIIKKEHDERCGGYTELLFFPPDAE